MGCSSFTCPPAPWTKVTGDPVCAATGCTKQLCCARLTTTPAPASPCTTAVPASPCTTHAMRLYSAGEQGVVQKAMAVKQDATNSQVSLWMVLPMFALFSFGALAIAVVIRRRASGNMQYVRLVQAQTDEDLLSPSSDAEMIVE